MITDPFLNYFALGILFFVVVVLFYGIIAIHDIPHVIAKSRNHPHQDAIHAAGWVSLFTLHALWPFLWIWAMAYRPDRGWGVSHKEPAAAEPTQESAELERLRARLAALEAKLATGHVAPAPPIGPTEPKLAPGSTKPNIVVASEPKAEPTEPKLVPEPAEAKLPGPSKTKAATGPTKAKVTAGDR